LPQDSGNPQSRHRDGVLAWWHISGAFLAEGAAGVGCSRLGRLLNLDEGIQPFSATADSMAVLLLFWADYLPCGRRYFANVACPGR
jgi:hypothetical protein